MKLFRICSLQNSFHDGSIAGLGVKTTYTGRENVHMVFGVSGKNTITAEFKLQNGQITNVRDYFRNKYDIELEWVMKLND